jgi:8-oxo-dGTP diphosphatase
MTHEVVAALIIQSQMILLGLRSAERMLYPDVWDLFGGHVEPGEGHQETLVRELQEELGITPAQWTFLETMTLELPAVPGAPAAQLIVHLYLVTAWTGSPANRQPEEHTTIGWFSLSEAIRLPLADPIYSTLFARYLGFPPS